MSLTGVFETATGETKAAFGNTVDGGINVLNGSVGGAEMVLDKALGGAEDALALGKTLQVSVANQVTGFATGLIVGSLKAFLFTFSGLFNMRYIFLLGGTIFVASKFI
ncbi:uncharacterized protein TrAtP1_009726 [Trichoderma atroviride]|uniref:Uncharacterized protein n=1 Tax=Hypocrea atroviridis (strain ATCC 20476 / IMI 206040) TaxID=452589 RepID=G9NKU6_HYPAI|nr:uncharacterized protein TRIATDRAFT_305332 [Trichoderma atroviride IMI 206040]EHK48518.1 hypothetical protein TRIATDRAFT_305332 [Trichoderma atroviride IMI 206040]UKZ68703.1 hypothetical protein TrAtP1_009726 [Trichoderma atroviride]